MKSIIRWTLAPAILATLTQWNGAVSAQPADFDDEDIMGGTEQSAVLTIKPDGSCLFVAETVEPRTAAEQQVRMLERYQQMSEAEDNGAAAAGTNMSSTNAPKPFTDEELTKKLTDMTNERAGEGAEAADQKLNVEVNKDTALITTTRSFASLEEMLKDSDAIWNQSGVVFENARFETDTNGLLRLTLTPRSGMERYLKTFRSEWKLSGEKTELKLVFPGKVISSGFPETQTNATWLAVDGKHDESLDAVAKLYAAPTVITAEPAGLKLDKPLESKTLRRLNRQHGGVGDDLPITNAGPGFVAEAQGITTTILHVFPGGGDYFKQNGFPSSPTGAVVTAKLFAPRGRTLLSVSDVQVLSAVDNKGRSVVADAEEGEGVPSQVYSGNSSDADSMQVQLRLQLPQPDAQAIDEVSAEAVAVTAGAWQEMTLTNLQENATNELDLSGVLPGAKIAITKLSSRDGQFNIQARLQGPRTVQSLDVRAKMPGNDNFNTYSSDRRFTVQGGQATRTLAIQGFGVGDESGSSPASLVLVVRCPQDLRREQVKFELKGLDLF